MGFCLIFLFSRCNLGFSGYVVFTHYLDNKTVTVFLTNALFMALKLMDTKTITETEENIFLSAYLTRKIQYNDVDPDKLYISRIEESKPIEVSTIER